MKTKHFTRNLFLGFLFLLVSVPAFSNPLSPSNLFQKYLQPQSNERLNQVLFFVQNQYVEPKRIDFSQMFSSSIKELSLSIAELSYISNSSEMILVSVGDQSKEFSTKVASVFGLRNQLTDLLKFVNENKKSDLEDDLIEEIVIQGVLKTLDPHSVFLSQEVLRETNVDIEGKFGGLGIVIGIRDGHLTVISPMDDTPASKAGIQAGDRITKIEKELTTGMSLTEAVSKMRGPRGTAVTLGIWREGMDKEESYKIVRDIIQIINIDAALLSNNVGYLKLKRFDKSSAKEIAHEIQQLQAQAGKPLQGLILDLRNNPGGLLDQSIEVADLFLSQGVIVSTVERGNRAGSKAKAKASGKDFLYPMIVLINQGSASASEIVAGALQKNNRALIIGQKTFGKGTVQKIYELPKQTALKLTVSKYLTADDLSIQSVGITPDIETQPVWIKDDVIRFYDFLKLRTESTLDHHFENAFKADQSLDSIAYLLKDLSEEDQAIVSEYQFAKLSTADKQKRLFQTFEVELAHQILSTPHKNKSSRLEIFEQSKGLLAKIEKQKQIEIQTILSKTNLDWTYPPITTTKCDAKDLRIQTTLLPTKDKLKGGETVELVTLVNNPTTCTFYQVKTITESKNPSLDQQFIYIGKVAPGQNKNVNKKIEIPSHQPSGIDIVHLETSDGQNLIHIKQDLHIPFQQANRPQFTATASIGGKDSQLQLTIEVENLGKVESKELLVQIKQKGSKTLILDPSRIVLENLKAGKKQTATFPIKTEAPLTKDEILQIQIADFDERFVLEKEVPLQDLSQAPMVMRAPIIKVPTIEFSQTQKTYTLQGTIEDNQQVKDMYIFVNDEKIFYQAFSQKNSKETFAVPIVLSEGSNSIQIVARDHLDVQGGLELRMVQGPINPLVSDGTKKQEK